MMLSKRFLSAVTICGVIVWTVGIARAGGEAAPVDPQPSSPAALHVDPSASTSVVETDRPDWATVVDQLSQALVEDDARGVLSLITSAASLQPFDRSSASGLQTLLACTSGKTLVSARAYDTPGATVASDIAADLRNATDLDVEVRKLLVPESDSQIRRANETALKWLHSELEASAQDPIGVIVLYEKDRAARQSRSFKFVLIKGERDAQQTFLVSRVVFGDPLDSKPPADSRASTD